MAIRERQLGNTVSLEVDGRLVMGGQDSALIAQVDGLLQRGHRHILLNLKDVTQVDTSGIAALTQVRAAAERYRATIKLLNLPRRVYDLLVITRLVTVFELFDSEAEALRSFGQTADTYSNE